MKGVERSIRLVSARTNLFMSFLPVVLRGRGPYLSPAFYPGVVPIEVAPTVVYFWVLPPRRALL